jgi:hypothetical protein
MQKTTPVHPGTKEASYVLLVWLWIVLLIWCWDLSSAHAQTNIGGVINTYTKVTNATNACGCPSTNCGQITVASAAGFSAGDKVLLIQMKGARVDTTNSAQHGSVLNLFSAGNYEFATIASISGTVITTTYSLKETYFTSAWSKDSACVQLVRVPVYAGDVNVTSTLMPQAWNGSSGGVLALEVGGTLTLQANISADGKGFRAARYAVYASSCGDDTAFYYQSTIWNHSSCTSCGYAYDDVPTRRVGNASYGGCGTTCFTNRMNSQDQRVGAYRGEGVAANNFRKTFANGNIAYFDKGKGRWSNGGGGGSNHNGGGGGGGNYGAGGSGGNAYNTSGCPAGTLTQRKGYGGAALTPTASKIYMGGGGGEGHNNGGQGSTGTAGGGIIIIKANYVANSGSYTISANGVNQTYVATGDGSGGGGAGGTILLKVPGEFGDVVNVSAKGGSGGNHGQASCHGPGGGGGGGVIWFSMSPPPANVNTDVSGGANGSNTHPSFDCGTASWGAASGSAGAVLSGLASGASAFFNTNTCGTVLPIELTSFSATATDFGVDVNWQTATEINNDYFVIERSKDAVSFTEVARVQGVGNSIESNDYSITDESPYNGMNYYRMRQTDFDGTTSFSQIVGVEFNDILPEIAIYPVPSNGLVDINVSRYKHFDLNIASMDGRTMTQGNNIETHTQVDTQNFPAGVYLVRIEAGGKSYFRKLTVSQ